MTPAKSNSFSNGVTNREGICGPLAEVPEVFKGLSDPRMR